MQSVFTGVAAASRRGGRLNRSVTLVCARPPAGQGENAFEANKSESDSAGPSGHNVEGSHLSDREAHPQRRKPARRRSKGKAKAPGLYEVEVVTPPPQSLGIHALEPNTHNGEQISIEGVEYVVTSTIIQFKLMNGRYRRDHNKLEVQSTGRYLYNNYLQSLMAQDNTGTADYGKQD